jgi:hypothetical protein
MKEVVEVLQFQARMQAQFRRNPTAFSTILNMALYHHTTSLDFPLVSAHPRTCMRPPVVYDYHLLGYRLESIMRRRLLGQPSTLSCCMRLACSS